MEINRLLNITDHGSGLTKDGVNWISESKGRFTRGTGEFQSISETITIKVERKYKSYTSATWEAQYEIK